MEGIIYMLGKVNEAVIKSVRVMADMGMEESESFLAVLPWIKVQQEIVRELHITQEKIGIKIILGEEDFHNHWERLRVQENS